MWAAGIVAVMAILVTARSLKVVPANQAWVIERLGRYHATLNAGVHVLLPLIDRIAFRFPLEPKEIELSETAITLDNVPVTITSRVRSQIIDAKRAAYAAADRDAYLAAVITNAQRHWISARKESDVRQNTRELEAEVARAAADTMERAGVRLEDVSVLRIERAG